jgi:hypothetical protein
VLCCGGELENDVVLGFRQKCRKYVFSGEIMQQKVSQSNKTSWESEFRLGCFLVVLLGYGRFGVGEKVTMCRLYEGHFLPLIAN